MLPLPLIAAVPALALVGNHIVEGFRTMAEHLSEEMSLERDAGGSEDRREAPDY